MATIIQVVTTPLAFAALIVLVLGGAYGFKRRKSAVVGREAFWLILVFGLIANVFYLLQTFVGAEAVISGNVRDNADKAIGFASIDVPGVGRGLTLDDGSFQISVPWSRQRPSYDLVVSAAGHARKRVTATGQKPGFQEIRLDLQRVRLGDLIDVKDTLIVTQNVGEPLIIVRFKVKSQLEGRSKIADLQVRLSEGGANPATFFPFIVDRNGIPFQTQYLQSILIDADQTGAEFAIMLSSDPSRTQNMATSAMAKFGPQWFQGCFDGKGLQGDTLTFFEQYFDQASTWRPAAYTGALRATVDGIVEEQRFRFPLTQAEAGRLTNMRSRLRQCAGLMGGPPQLGNLSYSDPTASNAVPVRIEWQ